MGTRKELQVGDLVRVSASNRRLYRVGHFHKAGAVGVVESLPEDTDNCHLVRVGTTPQYVPTGLLKLAKQAMKKRDQYQNRR